MYPKAVQFPLWESNNTNLQRFVSRQKGCCFCWRNRTPRIDKVFGMNVFSLVRPKLVSWNSFIDISYILFLTENTMDETCYSCDIIRCRFKLISVVSTGQRQFRRAVDWGIIHCPAKIYIYIITIFLKHFFVALP